MRPEDAAIKARDDADVKQVDASKKETGKAQLQAMIAETGNAQGVSKRKQRAFLTQLVKKGKGGVQKRQGKNKDRNKHRLLDPWRSRGCVTVCVGYEREGKRVYRRMKLQ